ncbi:uncharacterized protein LOC118199244 isoform X2 [Stegodyphus dumicola]|uniref:uncharacterized protein LOC118199244 isoform X2 n=1 Tax=Stegodyphus dumicola TaxID=202533 RepID=UPI0015A7CE10|nr:uncharacterized protein LOC118199244 isoform X2 [Stegodyphus dumicola]
MAYSNILSLIWKNRYKYELINENLIIESTFMQQTSGCENLWKAQLGMTANYIILFRYNIESINTSKHKESSSVLLSMIPIETLRITKYPRRKLEICTLDGSYSFYKLIKHRGCGTAWSKWKSLHGTIPKEKLKLNVELRLIPFIDLDKKIKNQLKDEKFIYCLRILRRCSQKAFDLNKTFHIAIFDNKTSKGTASFEYGAAPAKKCSSMLKWIKGESRLSNFKSGSTSSGSKKNVTINTKAETIQNGEQLPSYVKTNQGSKDLNGRQAAEVRKKMRLVRRFGEGIPDGCVFDLTLSYHDQIDQNEYSKPKPPKRKKSTELGLFDDFSSEKIALKTLQQWSDYETDNNASEEELKREYQEDCRQILKAVRYFQNTSLPVLEKGIKKVKSVESFKSIALTKYQNVYLTSNVSLPNLHELALFRRTSRLSYVLGFDEENIESGYYFREDNPLQPLSFWIANPGTGQQNYGRFYSTDPIHRKMKAQRLKLNLLRWRNKGRWYDIREKCNLLVHSDDDSLNTKFLKTAALASKVIHQIEEEYPKRQTLWVESPERKNARVRNKSQKPTAEKNKKRSRKSVAEKKHMTSFKNINELKPLQVAQDLRRIQQRLFYEIESAEITRYILKPETVTEVGILCEDLFK